MESMVRDLIFWQGKKVLITGHTGFKGSWLSVWLQNQGADLVGYSLPPPTTPSLFSIACVEDGMTSIIGDVRNFEQFQSVIADHRPEIIFHMAAQSLVRHSYDNPVETYATNVMGTVHLLEAVRRTGGVKAIVNITSDKCYENQEWPWGYRENEPMGGFDPYSNSKGCAELVTSAFRNSFFNSEDFDNHGVALASARSGNVIGGGDWAKDRLIPDIMRAISAGKPVVVRNPDSIRPWQHVLEPLSGYLLLAQKLWEEGRSFAEAWNFGPNDEDAKPVSWVATSLTRMWGKGASWELDGHKHPHEAHYLKLDCSKAKSRIGWSPTWNLETTLRAIVNWHQEYLERKDMRAVVTEQINAFLKGVTLS
jgi:CDP-glucose 4,6-dehydratase